MAGLDPAIPLLCKTACRLMGARASSINDAVFDPLRPCRTRVWPYDSNPVGTFLFSLVSFMPDAAAMVSMSVVKSFSR